MGFIFQLCIRSTLTSVAYNELTLERRHCAKHVRINLLTSGDQRVQKKRTISSWWREGTCMVQGVHLFLAFTNSFIICKESWKNFVQRTVWHWEGTHTLGGNPPRGDGPPVGIEKVYSWGDMWLKEEIFKSRIDFKLTRKRIIPVLRGYRSVRNVPSTD